MIQCVDVQKRVKRVKLMVKGSSHGHIFGFVCTSKVSVCMQNISAALNYGAAPGIRID